MEDNLIRPQFKLCFMFLSFMMIAFFTLFIIPQTKTVMAAEKSVVKCNDQEFDSLEAAMDSVESGATIVFLKDISIEPESINIAQDVIFDLNGHTLSANNLEKGHLHYILTQSAGNCILRNGKLTGEEIMGISIFGKGVLSLEDVEIKTNGRAMNVRDDAKVTIDSTSKLVSTNDDCTIMVISQYDGLDWGKRPYLTVYGTVISQTDQPAISGHGNDSGKTHITIGEGANIQSKGTAVFQPQNGTLTIDEAKISGSSGVEVRQGILTVNEGAEIIGIDDLGFLSDDESLDPCTNSAAITIAEKPRKGQIRVYINGGTFKGDAALCSLELADHTTTWRTHQTMKEKAPLTAYVKIKDGIFDGDIFDDAGCLYGIAEKGQFKTNPAWQTKGFALQIYEFTGKNKGWFYVGESAQRRLETAESGTKIDLVNSGDLENVKAGLVLINKQPWDVIVNGKQTITNGRNITVE